MNITRLFPYLAFTALFFYGCADALSIEECATSDPYGFLSGVWHGSIVLFSFAGSLFSDDITIYALNNNGGWYDFGFIIGAGLLSGSVTITRSK